MNKVLKNFSLIAFALLCSVSNSTSSLSINHNLYSCSDTSCLEHNHAYDDRNHEHDNNEESNPIMDLPSNIMFSRSMATTSSSYGEVLVQANYKPEGCLKDTIWSSSDPSKIKIDVDTTDSSIATLICIEPFEGEIIIKAQSKYFENLFYTCKATYKDNFEITPLVSNVTLTGKRVRDCPGDTSYTFNYVNQVDVKTLYRLSEDVPVTYKVNGSGVILNGDYLRMNSAVNSTLSITITPTGYEDKAIDIPIKASFSTEVGNHNYVKTLVKASYTSSTSRGSWGEYVQTKAPTCTSSGEKRRSRTGTYYTYTDEYKYTCSYCNHSYNEGGKATAHTDTEYDYAIVEALGHNYSKTLIKEAYDSAVSWGDWEYGEWTTTKEATCTSTGTKTRTKTRSGTYYHYTAQYRFSCSRCGDSFTTGGTSSKKTTSESDEETVSISALGHYYTGMYSICCKKILQLIASSGSSATYRCGYCAKTFTFLPTQTPHYYRKCSRCDQYVYK